MAATMDADASSSRLKKAALAECIELQRKLIQVHEEKEQPAAGSSSADADSDMSWYNEQAARLDKFKAALNAVRLQPDEFAVRVALQWPQAGSGAAAGDLRPHLLRINARSQITLVRARPAQQSGEEGAVPAASTSPGDGSTQPRVFFVDLLRHVRVASSPPEGASSTADGDARAVTLEWKAPEPPPLCCVTPEADELAEVIGAHLRRYNQSRVATVQGLQQAHALKCTPYSSANPSHERLLRRLWECGFPGVPLTQRCNEHWLHLGFQGSDPATDFRGMGILGLTNLVYFGEHYPDVFRRLVTAQGKRDYPLACAGINVTSMLLELLRIEPNSSPEQVQQRPPFSDAWDSPMLCFFCHMFYRDRPFEDMYCFCLRALDRMFVSMDADCADFPLVIASLRARVQDALAQRPLSFREFKRAMGSGTDNSSRDSCDSGEASTSSNDAAHEHEERGFSREISEALKLASVAGVKTLFSKVGL